jgi:hypothetical protein
MKLAWECSAAAHSIEPLAASGGGCQTNQAGLFNNGYFSGKNYAKFFVVELIRSNLICCGKLPVISAAHCYRRPSKTSDVLEPRENIIIFVE